MKGRLEVTTHEQYIASVDDARRSDIAALDRMIREVAPQLEPHIRSGTMGYGYSLIRYAGGRESEWSRIAVASNKSYISLYCTAGDERGYVAERFRERLPKASIGKSCVRFKRLSDLDDAALRDLIRETAETETVPEGS